MDARRLRLLEPMRKTGEVGTSNGTKIRGTVVGLVMCALGVGWLLVRGPEPFGTLLTLVGGVFAVSLLASLWIYRSR